MRHVLITMVLLGLAAPAMAQDAPPPGSGPEAGGGHGPGPGRGFMRGPLFISPMGEPFRGGDGPPQLRWFDGADTDHDGALTMAEFQADAARFFKLLDRKGDGEIDPDDIDYYETVLAPEIRSGGFGGGPGMGGGRRGGGGGRHGGGGGRRGGGGGGGFGGGGPGGGDGPDGGGGGQRQAAYPMKQGAARFSWFDYPEPVTVADRNFNRGVDTVEFARAAQDRFDMLDTNHDGKIARDELPKTGPMQGRGERRGGPAPVEGGE